jgi:hypothetical protein
MVGKKWLGNWALMLFPPNLAIAGFDKSAVSTVWGLEVNLAAQRLLGGKAG